MNSNITLYRKRIIPDEFLLLKDDVILHVDEALLVTSWTCLKPRNDIAYGYSAYFLSEGIKVSKIYNQSDALVYWYCDIIQSAFDASASSYVMTDLLLDVVVYPDGTVRLLDLDELADALCAGSISTVEAARSLRTANTLLAKIHSGQFSQYQDILEQYIAP